MKNQLTDLNMKHLKDLQESSEAVTYKDLCELLGLPICHGNSKTSQLTALKTYCCYHINTRPTRYVIDCVYDTALPMVNGTYKYVPYIEYIICSLLTVGEEVYMSNLDVLTACQMANENYRVAKYAGNRRAICNQLGYNIIDFDIFVDTTYTTILLPIIRSALLSLQKRKVLTILPAYKVKKKTGAKTYMWQRVDADSELGKEILKLEYQVQQEMHLVNHKRLYGDVAAHYYHRCARLVAEELGYEGYCSCMKIVTHKDIISDQLPKLRRELNRLIGDKIENSVKLQELADNIKKQFIEDMIAEHPTSQYRQIVDEAEEKAEAEKREKELTQEENEWIANIYG